MSKADELWEKYCTGMWTGNHTEDAISKSDFLAAITEYGEHVKAEAVKVCEKVNEDIGPANETGWGSVCAAAISKMKLP